MLIVGMGVVVGLDDVHCYDDVEGGGLCSL